MDNPQQPSLPDGQRPDRGESGPPPGTRPTNIRWIVFGLACGTSWMLYLHRYTFALIKPKLVDEGWKASNLRGSIVSWTHVGGDLVKDGAPTKRVHVYGRKWNLLADGYEAVW